MQLRRTIIKGLVIVTVQLAALPCFCQESKWNKFVRQFGSQIVFFASAAQCPIKKECWTKIDYQKMKDEWNGGENDTFNDVIKPFSGSISNPFDIRVSSNQLSTPSNFLYFVYQGKDRQEL